MTSRLFRIERFEKWNDLQKARFYLINENNEHIFLDNNLQKIDKACEEMINLFPKSVECNYLVEIKLYDNSETSFIYEAKDLI
jgi:hypothetical protein